MCVFLALAVVTSFFLKEQAYEVHTQKATTSFLALVRTPESMLFFGLAFLAFMSHAPFNVFCGASVEFGLQRPIHRFANGVGGGH